MQTPALPFRLPAAARDAQLRQFNARAEVRWFGFEGEFQAPGFAVVRLRQLDEGLRGGGGTDALNGGVIAAGFDAAFVLAGLGHYASEVVVTLELGVKFLSLARAGGPLVFRAQVVRSARNFAFAEGVLADETSASAAPFAIATAMVAPAGA